MSRNTGNGNRSKSKGDRQLQLDLAAVAQSNLSYERQQKVYEEWIVPEDDVPLRKKKGNVRKRSSGKMLFKVFAAVLCLAAILIVIIWDKNPQEEALSKTAETNYAALPDHPEWTTDYLTVSGYARPGTALKEVKSIFVHYTANPGTSAAQNRSYFENLRITKERAASAHFIIGYEGEIINCIPTSEKAYAVIGRNDDSISIECCYKDENGIFTEETYESLVTLLAWLLDAYELESKDILRHYDAGGKLCPLYYVEHENAWEQLKKDVDDYKMSLTNSQ